MDKTIKRNIGIIVGMTVLILIGMMLAWGSAMKKQNASIAQTQGQYDERKKVADALPTALIERKKAEDKRKYLQGQLDFFRGPDNPKTGILPGRYRALYFGDINGTSPAQIAAREKAWRDWMWEYYAEYGIALRNELIDTANAAGVLINTSIKINNPPKTPEEVILPTNGFFKPTGGPLGVTVEGTLPQILDFLNLINRETTPRNNKPPILMLVDRGIKLENFSPRTKATFSVTPYLLAKGPGVKLQTAAPAPAGAGPDAEAGGAPGAEAPGAEAASPPAAGDDKDTAE